MSVPTWTARWQRTERADSRHGYPRDGDGCDAASVTDAHLSIVMCQYGGHRQTPEDCLPKLTSDNEHETTRIPSLPWRKLGRATKPIGLRSDADHEVLSLLGPSCMGFEARWIVPKTYGTRRL